MKSKILKILGVTTTVAMLVSVLGVIPAFAVTQPQVTLDDYVISRADVDYTISFSIATALTAAGDSITVTLPAATIINETTVAGAIGASPGWVGTVWTTPVTTGVTVAGNNTAHTVTFTLGAGDVIGATASIFLVINTGVTNPGTPGDYQLTVKTSKETTAVSSTVYTITAVPAEYPGIVKVYNSAGYQMDQKSGTQPITDALAVAAEGYVLEVGPGFYDEPAALTVGVNKLTVKASGALADTVIKADWVINANEVTLKGLTLKNDTGVAGDTVVSIGAAANKVTIDGCAFVKVSSSAVETFINYSNATASGAGTVTNCSFDSTLGDVAADIGINVAAGAVGLTISKNTFNVDSTTAPAEDYAVKSVSDAKISENKFTGASGGIGVYSLASGKTVAISKNTFDTLTRAMAVGSATEFPFSGGTVNFTENTVTGCGQAISTTYAAGAGGIAITVATKVTIVGNKITGSKSVIAVVYSASAAAVTYINLNDLSGNTLGLMNYAGTPAIDATHNWWGAATGPTATQQTYYTSAALGVDASGYLGAAPSNTSLSFAATSIDTKSTAGVIINLDAAQDRVGIASYSANPGAVAPASDLKVVKYYEVFIAGTGATKAEVQFYGTVNAFCEVYYYSAFSGAWVKLADQIANVGAGAVIANVAAADLKGTAFVLVEAPPAAPGGGTSAAWMPALGAVDVPVDTTFTWPTVPGAVSYTFELAEETGQTDKFYLKDEVGSAAVNAYKLIDDLKYDTQYWWRVQSVNALGVKSAWTTAFFTTEKEPEEAPPPVVIEEQQPPVITLEIPPSTIEKVEPIPSYLLWLVIGVGAVLVIVVIVLIVRTRRIS